MYRLSGMAIQFARVRYLSRSKGHSAIRSAAYNARTAIRDDRTGTVYDFRDHSPDLRYHRVLLPDGEHPHYMSLPILWNTVEAGEKRKDSQLAREFVLALPADRTVLWINHIELAESFFIKHFVKNGLIVQMDFHDDPGNPHVHALVTTRRFQGGAFSTTKARDLDPVIKRGAYGRAFVAEGELWGQLWAEHQQAFFVERKLDIIVDPIAIIPGREHFGPKRAWASDIPERIALLKQQNAKAARDPELVFRHLQETQQRFDGRVLKRFLDKHLPTRERDKVRRKVLELQRDALKQARHADKTPSHSRPLTIEDIARQRSEKYREAVEKIAELQKAIVSIGNLMAAKQQQIHALTYDQATRYDQMNGVQRFIHKRFRDDAMLRSLEDRIAPIRHEHALLRQRRDQNQISLLSAKGRAKVALDEVRAEADRELQRRQRSASAAHERLNELRRDDRSRLRPDRAQERSRE